MSDNKMIKEETEQAVTEQQEDQQARRPKIKWLPLESNPDVLNKIIHEHGVHPEWSFIDVIGFDDESLALIPRPAAAIIFLFPCTANYNQFREKEESHLKIHEQNISPSLMYFKQTISNACGMMALLHSLSNNGHLVGPGGLFDKIIQDTRSMSPQERGEYLETCEELAKIHDYGARHGQSKTPELDDQVSNHFISFVEVDDHLYELDGTRSFPINHGKCIDFIQDAAKIMRQTIERDPDEKDYVAIAFTKTEESA